MLFTSLPDFIPWRTRYDSVNYGLATIYLQSPLSLVVKFDYNIASRATQSNSVYVSALKIPIVLADSEGENISFCDNNWYKQRLCPPVPNYRPISLLSVPSKLLESQVCQATLKPGIRCGNQNPESGIHKSKNTSSPKTRKLFSIAFACRK